MKIETQRERELVSYWLDNLAKHYGERSTLEQFKQENNLNEPIELKNGKLYVLNSYPTVKVIKTGVGSGFGFDSCYEFDGSKWNYNVKPELWREATPEELEEFKQQLYKEAERRGYNKPNAVYKCMYMPNFTEKSQFKEFNYSDVGLYIYYVNGHNSKIMNSKGEWADITFEEEPKETIKDIGEWFEGMAKEFNERFLNK